MWDVLEPGPRIWNHRDTEDTEEEWAVATNAFRILRGFSRIFRTRFSRVSVRSFLLLAVLLCATIARAAEPHPSLPKAVIPDCLGVNIHFTDPKPGEMEMIAGAGFKWVRMDLVWGRAEEGGI